MCLHYKRNDLFAIECKELEDVKPYVVKTRMADGFFDLLLALTSSFCRQLCTFCGNSSAPAKLCTHVGIAPTPKRLRYFWGGSPLNQAPIVEKLRLSKLKHSSAMNLSFTITSFAQPSHPQTIPLACKGCKTQVSVGPTKLIGERSAILPEQVVVLRMTCEHKGLGLTTITNGTSQCNA
eukprot:1806115-Amphidinium_carterae.1